MFKYYLYIIITVISLQSCSDNEEGVTTEETTSSTIISKTKVTLTITTSEGELKEGYIIMMFDEVFNPADVLKKAVKQVESDVNGIAVFNLEDLITTSTSKEYYFEAFTETTNGFVLKSSFRTAVSLQKGSTITTSIIVK